MENISYEKWLLKLSKTVTERDFMLIKEAVNTLYKNIAVGEGIPWKPYRCIMPCHNGFEGIWNWDSAFHAVGACNWDTDLAKEQILGFCQYQCEDGMYPDVIRMNGTIEKISSKPPVMPWAAKIIYDKDKDKEFLKKIYPSLVKNEFFWRSRRFYKGLFHYDANTSMVVSEKYDLYVRYESGWDNSVRWNSPVVDYWPIDLNCFMVMFYRAMSFMAGELNLNDEAIIWDIKEKTLIDNIENNLWNENLKSYVDVNRFTREQSDVLTPASFMPLYIRTATWQRADCMHKLGSDKNKFFPGMPTVAYDNIEYSTDYWRGPTWLNVAYFAAKGLKNYGYDTTADDIKETILSWVEKDNGITHENYTLNGEGMGAVPFSWSSVFVIEFILNF